MKMETRSFAELGAPKVGEGRLIEGYAIVFNQESKIIYDKEKKLFFVEVIERGAVTEELLSQCDIIAVLEHETNRLLARSQYGSGTLKLSIDDYGLKFIFASPNTQEGDYSVEMVSRGDIRGCSFRYGTNEKDRTNVSYSKKDGIVVRTVHKIDRIADVSLVTNPAFIGTEVTARSLEEVGMGEVVEPQEQDNKENDYLQQINELKKLI